MEETTKIVCDLDTDSKEKQFMLSEEKSYRLTTVLFFHYTNGFNMDIAWKSCQFSSSNIVVTIEYG